MPETVALGPCDGIAFDQGGASWAVILPGAAYSVQAPLLWFARREAIAAGRNVLAVVDTFARDVDPVRWVEERFDAALAYVGDRDPRPVVIAKSLTTLAASSAAQRSLPAVWLTPLIAPGGPPFAPLVLAGLREGSAPRLLIGGSADPSWDGSVARSLPAAQVLELQDADHGLEVADIGASIANLEAVADAIRRFLEGLA
jgi:hypothetical protein